MHYRQNLLLGALLILIAELCMASMGAMVKHLGETLPNEMVVFVRNIAGLLTLIPLYLSQKSCTLKTKVLHLHLLRGIAGVSAMYCFFYALIHLPLADGMLLKMTAPLFMPLIAFFWLSEGISRWTVIALGIGFAGVWIILDPTNELNWFAMVGLAGGLFAALAKVTIRRLAKSEPTARIVIYFALVGSTVSVIPLSWAWVTPGVEEIVFMIGVGLVGTLGQLALTRGYSVANAGTVAPLSYFSVVFGGIYGYLLWQEIPTQQFLLGALLIAVAGLLTLKKDKPATVIESAT